jgi:hypothetical protein
MYGVIDVTGEPGDAAAEKGMIRKAWREGAAAADTFNYPAARCRTHARRYVSWDAFIMRSRVRRRLAVFACKSKFPSVALLALISGRNCC